MLNNIFDWTIEVERKAKIFRVGLIEIFRNYGTVNVVSTDTPFTRIPFVPLSEQ